MFELIAKIGLSLLKTFIDKKAQDDEMRRRFYEFYRVYEQRKNPSYEHMKDIERQLGEEEKND